MGARLLLLWAVSVVIWWGFAFWPTPMGDQSWLAVAQAACFGSLPGGLPAAHGWMMLTLAPLMLLGAIIAVYGSDIAHTLSQRLRTWPWRLAFGALTMAFAVEVTWAISRVEASVQLNAVAFASTLTEPLPDDYPRGSTPAPAFELIDQAGRSFSLATLSGRPAVVSFIFAHCQTVCPAIVGTIKNAAQAPEAGDFATVLVTLDPWRDTPTALPAMAEAFALPEPGYLLSGPPDNVTRVLDAFGVAYQRNTTTGDVAHAPLVVIVDRDGRIAYQFNNPPAHWIAQGLRRVQGGS